MTDLGRRMKEGSLEERRRGRSLPPVSDKCTGFAQSSSKPEHHTAPARLETISSGCFLARAVPYFRSLRSILQEEGKKPSSGPSLAHVAEKDSFYCHKSLCQLPSPDRQPGQTCFLFPFRPIPKEIFPHKTYNWCSSSRV